MDIKGKITGIKYKILLSGDLKEIDIKNFNINDAPSACLLKDSNNAFAISKWVSPKRTRTYPYERVFNTLHISKKVTVIPIVKDEGEKGDRDFIQWDTVSLMSLLDVFVIFAYYEKADKKVKKLLISDSTTVTFFLKSKKLNSIIALHYIGIYKKLTLICITSLTKRNVLTRK